MNTSTQFHGSDLEKIEEFYHIPKESIVSFSANVNPLGISPKIKSRLISRLDDISRYPDREYTDLRKAISAYTGAAPDHILPGNGCSELISLFMKALTPRETLILGPTYSEYEHSATQIGSRCEYFLLQESRDFRADIDALITRLTASVDLLVICNPNNPTSGQITVPEMEVLLKHCQENNIFILVDETYAEFAPEDQPLSAIPLTASYSNLMVLRGTSKFFAAPGLRLGYGITGNTEMLLKIKECQDPWSTNILAEIAGCVMFSDTEYIAETKQLINSERRRLMTELSGWSSVKVYPTLTNLFLVRIIKPGITADMLFEHCIRKGLMIRNCASFDGLDDHFFRFCIMLPEDNDRLLTALREILEQADR